MGILEASRDRLDNESSLCTQLQSGVAKPEGPERKAKRAHSHARAEPQC